METVPCVRVENLTEEQIRELRIIDNKLNESDWDIDLLKEDLDELDFDDFDIDWGIDEDNDMSSITEDEPVDIDEEAEPIAKRGDIYRLGNHRLMCGDSTSADDVQKLMNGEKAKLLLTDPPYGIDVVQNKSVGGGGAIHFKGKVGANNIVKANNYMPIIGDDTTDTAKSSYEVSTEFSDNQIIFGGNYFTDFLKPSRCWIVWDKENTGNFADAELAWTSFEKGVKLYRYLWNGLCREGSRDVEGITRVHPTQKPVGLMGNILNDFTEENDSVLDLFGGSGSTLIACEQLERRCFMMELEPHYVDVIIQRWENFTGKKAEKIEKEE